MSISSVTVLAIFRFLLGLTEAGLAPALMLCILLIFLLLPLLSLFLLFFHHLIRHQTMVQQQIPSPSNFYIYDVDPCIQLRKWFDFWIYHKHNRWMDGFKWMAMAVSLLLFLYLLLTDHLSPSLPFAIFFFFLFSFFDKSNIYCRRHANSCHGSCCNLLVTQLSLRGILSLLRRVDNPTKTTSMTNLLPFSFLLLSF